jgi:hypothetical protein
MVETELQRATELEADSEAPASSVNASSLETAENGKPTPVTAEMCCSQWFCTRSPRAA